jgi:hypothetical protein
MPSVTGITLACNPSAARAYTDVDRASIAARDAEGVSLEDQLLTKRPGHP